MGPLDMTVRLIRPTTYEPMKKNLATERKRDKNEMKDEIKEI